MLLSNIVKQQLDLSCKALCHEWLISPNTVIIRWCQTQSVSSGKAARTPADVAKEDI